MRYLVVAAVMAVGVGVFGVGGASAAPASGQPISQNAEQASSVAIIPALNRKMATMAPHSKASTAFSTMCDATPSDCNPARKASNACCWLLRR